MRSFADDLEGFADSIALIASNGETLTYSMLAAQADAFAKLLTETGPLLLEASNATEAIVAYLACLRSRRPVILAGPDATAKDDRIARSFRPAYLYRQSGLQWQLERLAGNDTPSHPDLAVLLSTSGTTGSPKLVRLSHKNLTSNADAIAQYLELDAGQRAITSLPFFYSFGMSVVNSHLSVGASLVLTDRSVTDGSFWKHMTRHSVTSLAGVPFTYELLEQRGFRDRAPSSLQILTQAGGRLAPPLVSAYAQWAAARGIRFYVMYGQTEAAPRMAYMPPERLAEYPNHIGVPIPAGKFTVVDDDGCETRAGEPGELLYTGPNVMMGYAERAEDLALPKTCHQLFTGDLAVRDDNGLYRIVGRKGRFAKPFGLRISLDEIEAVLQEGGIAAIAASADANIYLCVTSGSPKAAVDLLVDRYRIPAHVFAAYAADEIPRLPSGKIDYAAVIAPGRASAGTSPVAEGNNAIANAMPAVFNRPVSSSDSFASLGGDSLSYVQTSLEIERLLGYLPEGWEQLSIHQLQAFECKAHLPQRRFFTLQRVDTEIVLRAAAVIAILLHHALFFGAAGGLDTLLLLMGTNLARFQTLRLTSPGRWGILSDGFVRLVLPYYAIISIYGFFHRPQIIGWADYLLTSNFIGRQWIFTSPYWFVPAYMQALLVLIALALLPPVKRLILQNPGIFGAYLLVGALAIKIASITIFQHHNLVGRTPDQFLYIVALGWCIQTARTFAMRVTLASFALLVALLGYFGPFAYWSSFAGKWHGIALAAAALTLLIRPALKLPQFMRWIIIEVATASLFIYLLHPPLLILSYKAHIEHEIGAALVLLISIACSRLFNMGLRWWLDWRARSRAAQDFVVNPV